MDTANTEANARLQNNKAYFKQFLERGPVRSNTCDILTKGADERATIFLQLGAHPSTTALLFVIEPLLRKKMNPVFR
jgi:hypothetical protein